MKAKLIKNLHGWINELIRRYRVIAPKKLGEKDFVFEHVKSSSDVALEYLNPLISPVKEILFPPREVLLKYKKKGNTWEVNTKVPEEKTVLFGIRSCDIAAMQFMDKFFLEGFKDNYYEARRKNLYTVSITCTDPAETCFCICADCGPSRESGFDLQLTKINEEYLVETGSAKGEELLVSGSFFFSDAEEKHIEETKKIIEKAKENFKMPTTYFSKAIRHVTANEIDEKTLKMLGDKCIACGSCSYVCPTCSCFNVTDEGDINEGERVRTWDSCMYAGFTREVSGHNPRPVQKERVKRRYYHKLSYYYVRKMGSHGCVGCGRCVLACLGGIDMSEVSKAVRRKS
jgi:ferredoxin